MQKGAQAGLVFDPVCGEHDPGAGHPESMDRYVYLERALKASGLMASLPRIPARDATDDELRLAHTSTYLEVVKKDIARRAPSLSTGDTSLGKRTLPAALRAAGGILNAIDATVNRQVNRAFCAVRPPGHHATASRGMGFCLFNGIALGARYAQKRHGIDRVLILDWDVHHGNGTQDIFWRDGSVFFFSTHQWPWYPGTGAATETGEGAGYGATMNCPFPAGAGRAEILGAVRKKLMPAMEGFKPGLVLISAGFDSRKNDPLGRFLLKDADFQELTSLALEMADKYAGGRLVSVLEGGYNLEGLGAAAVAHLQTLRA